MPNAAVARLDDLAYHAGASDAAGLPLAVSLYADRLHLRAALREEALAAGLRVAEAAGLAALLEGEARPLGDIVLLDCPQVDGAVLAGLARLDLRAARCGTQVVVSTTLAALEDVFACMDQCAPQLLVDPSRADRALALGRALVAVPGRSLRELSDEDRLILLRLTEQVGQLAERMDRFAGPEPEADESAFRFQAPRRNFAGRNGRGAGQGDATPDGERLPGASGERATRNSRPPLPDPRLVRRILRQRQMRARFFDADLFADPAWDMLLDLTAARAEHQRVSVTSLCIASGVPPTTALRWIGQLIDARLFERTEDETDRRRAFIALTDRAADAMARYFAELGPAGSRLV